jgi:8-oxo-dGTP pyrophosphatase MutT (NUDIX family)
MDYVLINAIFNELDNREKCLLVLKDRPKWQAGFYNLIGGKVESDEDPESAALRELTEETGLVSHTSPILMGRIVDMTSGQKETVYCYNVFVERKTLIPRHVETETVSWHIWSEIVISKELLPSVRLIFPLMHMDVRNWEINANTSFMKKEKNGVQVVMMGSEHPDLL